jgi:hypothetical protein
MNEVEKYIQLTKNKELNWTGGFVNRNEGLFRLVARYKDRSLHLTIKLLGKINHRLSIYYDDGAEYHYTQGVEELSKRLIGVI